MALRQREWAIYIRPYHTRTISGNVVRIDFTGTPKAGRRDVGETSGTNTAIDLKGNGEGGGKVDTGGWTMWFKTTSFKLLREKYKEALQQTSAEQLRVVEIMNVDTLVTPLS